MELENFKELWNKDTADDLPEVSLEKQKEIHSPLQMLKLNMETEFWLMIITLPMLMTGFPFASHDSNIKIISAFVVVLTLALIVYFYSRFLKLYKMLCQQSINTNYDLFNLKTQLLISKEIYIAYYISYIPLAFLLSLITINFHFEMKYNLAIFGVSFLITLLLVWFIVKYWIYYMYGRYIKDVVDLVDELNGIEVKPISKRKRISWFERSQKFFMNKFGIRGNILNTVIWFVFVYLFIIFFLTIVLLILIIAGALLDFIDLNELQKALDRMN